MALRLSAALRSGWSHMVGIVANNGVLLSRIGVERRAHFVQLCAQRRVPLVFLQNITGFMVGKDYERGHHQRRRQDGPGGADCGMCPKFTILIGASHGAGNYAMCGRAYGRISVLLAQRASR